MAALPRSSQLKPIPIQAIPSVPWLYSKPVHSAATAGIAHGLRITRPAKIAKTPV